LRSDRGGERRGALAKLLRDAPPSGLLGAIGAANELLPATLRLIGAHGDLDVLLRELLVVRGEREDEIERVESRVVLLAADRSLGVFEIVDLSVAVESLLRVEVSQRAMNLEVLLRDSEDLLADGDGVLEELAARVFVDGLAVTANRLLHRTPFRKEVRHQDEVVGVLIAAREELIELRQGGVDLPLLDQLLGLLLDREIAVHAASFAPSKSPTPRPRLASASAPDP